MSPGPSTDETAQTDVKIALTPLAEFWNALNRSLRDNNLPELRYGQVMALWERALDDAGMLAAENIRAES